MAIGPPGMNRMYCYLSLPEKFLPSHKVFPKLTNALVGQNCFSAIILNIISQLSDLGTKLFIPTDFTVLVPEWKSQHGLCDVGQWLTDKVSHEGTEALWRTQGLMFDEL